MSDATTVIVLLAAGTYCLKALGPLYFGNSRQLPVKFQEIALLLPTPLIAALVVTSAFSENNELVLDARVIGLVAAAIALWKKLPFFIVVIIAAHAALGRFGDHPGQRPHAFIPGHVASPAER